MISKISGLNPVATSNHKEELSTSSNKSSEIAQKALNEMQNQAESSLCNRFVKILKDIIKKIQNCFFRCFYIKNDKIDSETERSLNPAKTTEKTDFEPSKNSEVKTEVLDEKWNDTNFVEKTIFNIMALMLPKSELDYLKWDKRLEGAIVDPETPFTAEEKLQRYEALKKAINDLPSQFLDLNVAIDRDKSTLLLFAIDQINDKDQRFEIVKLLLQKGASIETISGLYEVKTNAINAAQEKGDFRLVGLFLGVGSREQLSLQSLEEARDILLNFVHKDIEIFKKLRQVIGRILPEHLNNLVEFKIENNIHQATLLNLALAKMERGSMLNWIIKDLLDRNANLDINGTINGHTCNDYNTRLVLRNKASYLGWSSI